MNEIRKGVSLGQISDMKHAIGFDSNSELKVGVDGNRVYEYYRTYFITGSGRVKRLDELVEIGLMEVYQLPQWYCGGFCYSLTDKGIKLLEQIYSINIRRRK